MCCVFQIKIFEIKGSFSRLPELFSIGRRSDVLGVPGSDREVCAEGVRAGQNSARTLRGKRSLLQLCLAHLGQALV